MFIANKKAQNLCGTGLFRVIKIYYLFRIRTQFHFDKASASDDKVAKQLELVNM